MSSPIQLPGAPLTYERAYWPGVIGEIASAHATYYHDNWGFGEFFEARVATDLAEFIGRFDAGADALITARAVDAAGCSRLAGSVAIDGIHGDTEGAHLRWFIVSSAYHGQGLGKRLLEQAVSFCRERRYQTVYLWTFAGLDAARALYERHGFDLTREFSGDQWGCTVTEQRFEWHAD